MRKSKHQHRIGLCGVGILSLLLHGIGFVSTPIGAGEARPPASAYKPPLRLPSPVPARPKMAPGLPRVSPPPGPLPPPPAVHEHVNCNSWLDRYEYYADPCPTIRRGALPMPPGWYLRQWNDRMAAKAEADDFVVYLHEWLRGGTALNPYGMYHVALMASRLGHTPFTVVLQPQPGLDPVKDAHLNEARRLVIVAMLNRLGISDAAHRVLVAFPQAEGLRYNDLPGTGRGRGRGQGGRRAGTGSGGLNPFGGGLSGFGSGISGFGSIPRY